jgi:high-affinity iron transporter
LDADLFAGLCAATLGLAVLFYFINLLAQKLPLRPLFIITSAFLFAMAIKFIGEAVQEFQEQAMLPVTELKSTGWVSAMGLNRARGFIRATACDAVRAGNLFRCSTQQPASGRRQESHALGEILALALPFLVEPEPALR